MAGGEYFISITRKADHDQDSFIFFPDMVCQIDQHDACLFVVTEQRMVHDVLQKQGRRERVRGAATGIGE